MAFIDSYVNNYFMLYEKVIPLPWPMGSSSKQNVSKYSKILTTAAYHESSSRNLNGYVLCTI